MTRQEQKPGRTCSYCNEWCASYVLINDDPSCLDCFDTRFEVIWNESYKQKTVAPRK